MIAREIGVGIAIAVVSCAAAGCVEQPVLPVTRADIADAYLRFERTLVEYPPETGRVAALNRGFDEASAAFFAGQGARAVERINALIDSLLPEAERTAERAVAWATKLRVEPAVIRTRNPLAPLIEAGLLYRPDRVESGTFVFQVELRDPADRLVAGAQIELCLDEVRAAPLRVNLELPEKLAPGAYRLILVGGSGKSYPRARLYASERPLAAVRTENDLALDRLSAESDTLRQALAICRARNALLTDEPSEESSAAFLADPVQLAAELEEEIAALKAGRNPYAARPGEIWRVLGERSTPLRLYVPARLAAAEGSGVPLVVAFHGAGGDEQMFLYGYGAGRIRALAEERGFILACPLTYPFLTSPGLFDELLSALRQDYNIDGNRIYALGHSLGAGATGIIAQREGTPLRAAACIAGGRGWSTAAHSAPALVLAGQIDPLSPIGRLRADAERGMARGLPVEFREIDDYGHTLLVGRVLEEAIDWMFAQGEVGASSRAAPPETAPAAGPAELSSQPAPR